MVTTDQAASVDIALVSNGTITGRVVDAAGKPASGMGVLLTDDQPGPGFGVKVNEQPQTSGPDGRFAVQGQPGRRMLVVLGPHATPKHGITVTADKTIDIGDVVISDQHP